jgi:hypothetical protein
MTLIFISYAAMAAAIFLFNLITKNENISS